MKKKKHPTESQDVYDHASANISTNMSEYVHSFGSICGTVPYDKVIIALITFLENEHMHEALHPARVTDKVVDKMEEWNVMRSNTLSAVTGPIMNVDRRLFDFDQVNQILQCQAPTHIIKALKTFPSTKRMLFKFE